MAHVTPHLINVATPPCASQNTENVILQPDITKENCIRCTTASSEWTRVIMCLTFIYLGCYTAKHVWNKDSWHWRPAKTLDANLFWLWPGRHQCWRDHLRSCVHADGGHFERMLWLECSLPAALRTAQTCRYFSLVRGRFWGFLPRRGDTLHRWGWNLARRRGPDRPSSVPNFTSVQRQGCRTPKLKFLLRFDRNLEYKRPAGAYPLHDFHKICRVCTSF